MIFPIEKILTIDAKTYIESRERELSDYEFLGVSVSSHPEYIFENFQKKVPDNAEVITDLSYVGAIAGWGMTYLSGTALIPKK